MANITQRRNKPESVNGHPRTDMSVAGTDIVPYLPCNSEMQPQMEDAVFVWGRCR
jgi:hypothetical protein